MADAKTSYRDVGAWQRRTALPQNGKTTYSDVGAWQRQVAIPLPFLFDAPGGGPVGMEAVAGMWNPPAGVVVGGWQSLAPDQAGNNRLVQTAYEAR
jgi:hypothetical protein